MPAPDKIESQGIGHRSPGFVLARACTIGQKCPKSVSGRGGLPPVRDTYTMHAARPILSYSHRAFFDEALLRSWWS
jgi:hypothetical protein